MFNSPFTNPYLSRNIASNLIKSSKFSFTSIVSGLEKTISTINQIIPIYTQVKPLVSSSKSLLSSANKLFKKAQKQDTTNLKKDVINVDVQEIKKEEKIPSNINVTTPSKPFFI